MKIFRLFAFFLAVIYLSGCTTTQPVTYNPNQVSQENLATVSVQPSGFWGEGGYLFNSQFSSIYNAKKEKLPIGNAWSGMPPQVMLEAGVYVFIVQCTKGNAYNYHNIPTRLEPNEKYTIFCGGGYADRKTLFGEVKSLDKMGAFISKDAELDEAIKVVQESFQDHADYQSQIKEKVRQQKEAKKTE